MISYYLKIDGFGGASLDKAHQNWFDIDDFSIDVDHAASNGQFTLPPDFGALSVTGEFDAALAMLLSKMTSGNEVIRAVEIEGVDSFTGKVVYDLTLNDVVVSALAEGGSNASDSSENISFSYEKIGLVTSGGSTPQSFGYDLRIGESIDPLSLSDAKVATSTGVVPATQFFLRIDGVAGTSPQKDRTNWFDIDDFSLGVDRDPGDAKFRPHYDFGALSVTGEFDAALAALLSKAASGKGANISAVEIEGIDGLGKVVYDLTLNDVVVSAISGGGTDGSYSSENIVFSYGQIGLVTSGGTTSQSFGYDLVSGASIDPGTLLNANAPSLSGVRQATQFFLKIDEFGGASQDKGHENWFDIDAFSIDVDHAASNGQFTSLPDFGALSVTGEFDAALAMLLSKMMSSNGVIRAVEIEGVDISTGKVVYDLTLNDVVVSALAEGGTDGSYSSENISFSYEKIGLVTSGGSTPQSFGYDLRIGESIDPLSLSDAKVATSTGVVPATQFFLRIDGVAGTSPQKDRTNWFDIDDFSLGVDRDPGDAKFRPHYDFGALSVTGEFDAALAALLSKAASGKGANISAVEIEGIDGLGKVVYDLTLNDVVVSAISGGGTDGSYSSENIAFSYGKIGLVTSGGTTSQSFGYDLVSGASIDPGTLFNANAPSLSGVRQATQFFLKIDEFGGASQDKGHENWFDIDAFSIDVDHAASNGQFTSLPDFGALSVTGEFDAALAMLLSKMTSSNGVIRAVEIEGVDISTGKVVYDLTLNDVVVSALAEGGSNASDSPENISFSYEKIGLVTSGGSTPQSFGYDLSIGESIDPLSLRDAKVATSTGVVQEAMQFFLRIDGVAGTSPQKDRTNWFDIDDFSLGVDRDPGDAKFRPHYDFGALSVTGEFDAVLAALLSRTASGKQVISAVEIEGVDGLGKVVYDLTLNDVVVSAISGGGTDGSNTPENIVFSYGQIGLVTSGGTTSQSFSYDQAAGLNSPPQIIDSVIVTQVSTIESHGLFASDADGDPLTFAQSTPLPAGSATVSASGIYSYVAPAAAGVDAFTYTVSDGQGNVVTGRVDVTIVNGLSALDVTGTAGRDVLRGTKHADVFNGAGGDDLLYGGEGGDSLVGGTGNDSLYGESGADTLIGGQGNNLLAGGEGTDLYIIDNAGDLIVENTNEGVDAVRSMVTYTLAANVETLVLLGSGNLNGVGSSDNNILAGNSGNNVLDGVAGADIIAGGPGNDTYVVDNSGDQVMELGNSGIDQVLSGVSYDLMQAWHVENLTLTGGNAIKGSGNWLDNVITGNTGMNALDGNKGDDKLDGGAGDDTLRGGSGDDVLVYDAADGSIDGGAGTDTLRIDGSGLSIDLSGLGGGVIRDIEIIDISGSGSNILTLKLTDVLAMSSTTNILHIIGNADDDVDAGDNWIAESYSGSGPRTYTQGLATLLLEPDVGLNVP